MFVFRELLKSFYLGPREQVHEIFAKFLGNQTSSETVSLQTRSLRLTEELILKKSGMLVPCPLIDAEKLLAILKEHSFPSEDVQTYVCQTIQNGQFKTQENVIESINDELKEKIAKEAYVVHFKQCSLCRQLTRPYEALPSKKIALEEEEAQRYFYVDELVIALTQSRCLDEEHLKWENDR